MPDTVVDYGFKMEDVPCPVMTLRTEVGTGGYDHPPHCHRKAQLIFATRGFVTCTISNGLWMVAPQCALWIPSGLEHSVRTVGNLELYITFVEPDVVPDLPTECGTLAVSPLLRELLIESSRMSPPDTLHGCTGRLVHTMLDQVVKAPVEQLHLPMPSDKRLRKIAARLANEPADRATIREWAHRVSMSERTLCRVIEQQTGMSFGRWRQQFQIMYALRRMAEGEAVKSIALELGYETASAFITMFRKALGQPPARYYASRQDQRAALAAQFDAAQSTPIIISL